MPKRKNTIIKMPAIDKTTGENVVVFMEVNYLPMPKSKKHA